MKSKRFCFRIKHPFFLKVQNRADELGITVSEYIKKLLREDIQ